MTKIPKVFISYSHDSLDHKKWVLEIATRLRNFGVDAILDQWELQPGKDLAHFMETQLASADKVVMVCTPNYVQKANSGAGGVGYEKTIMTADYMKNIDAAKVIPIIRQKGQPLVPTFLSSKIYIDFTTDASSEYSFDELVRTIHEAPLYTKPPVGNNPFKPVEQLVPQKTADNLLELMRIVLVDFEKGSNYTDYAEGLRRFGASRIFYDLTIQEAVRKALIRVDADGDLRLLPGGKQYIVANNLVK